MSVPAHLFTDSYGNQLEYVRIGQGIDILFIFPGYGQTCYSASEQALPLAQKYTCFIFSLFYHGHSHWASQGDLISKKQWSQMMRAFCEENSINRFSVMGYSLGGKLALSCLDAFADQIDKVVLLAPEGMTPNFWYNITTSTVIGRKIFKIFMCNPHMLSAFVKVLVRLNCVNVKVSQFALSQTNTLEKCAQVYNTWTALRLLRVRKRLLYKILDNHAIPLMLFIGKLDTIMPYKKFRRFEHQNINLQKIDCSHKGLFINEKIINALVDC